MEQKNVKPGANATGPRIVVSAEGRNGNSYSTNGHFQQRTAADEMERTRSALEYINPRDHDTWLKAGMALKSEFGDDGWPIFDEWSRPAENYDERENRSRWRSFKTGGGITIGTVYGLARDAGWCDDGRHIVPDPEDLARRKRERAKADAEATEKRDRAAAETAKKASAIWSMAKPAKADNPYAQRKGIEPTATLREIDDHKAATVLGYVPSAKGAPLEGRFLVVPIKVGDKLSSAQLIDGTGRKHFLANGAIGGGYWAAKPLPAGDGADLLIAVGEGVATTLTPQQAKPTALGLAAMSNTSIPAVARQMRERYPRADIVVLADLDKTTGEPDKYAVEAARAVGGKLAVPRFDDGPAPDRKDMNDLARVHGVDTVRRVIEAAEIVHGAEQRLKSAHSRPEGPAYIHGLNPLNGEQLLRKKFDPVEQVLAPVLPTQGLGMVYGPRGMGKTHVALGMACAVAAGAPFLRWQAQKARRVLLIDGEMPGVVLQQRFAQTMNLMGQDIQREFFRLVAADLEPDGLPDLAHPDSQAFYEPVISTADLILVDNLSTVCRSMRENEADTWGPVQAWLLRLRRVGKSVVLFHHSGKAGGQRGTSRKEDVLNTVIALRRPPDYSPSEGARFEVHYEKARGFFGDDAEPFEAWLKPEGWTTGPVQQADDSVDTIASLRKSGFSVRDIAERTGVPKSTVGRRLKGFDA